MNQSVKNNNKLLLSDAIDYLTLAITEFAAHCGATCVIKELVLLTQCILETLHVR